LKNCYFSYNTVDMTNYVRSITFTAESETQDDTAMGDNWRSVVGGLKNGTIDVEFNADFDTTAVDDTLWAVLGTSAAFEIRPTTSAVGVTNPKWSGVGLITNYTPVTGTVGDLATHTVSIVCKTTVARAEA